MGGGQSKNSPSPPKGTPAYHMYVYYGPKTCRYLENWNFYTRDNPSKQFPLEGTFNLDKLTYLRGTLTSSKASDKQWEQFVYWWEEATKRLHESRVRSLKDSQEKLKTQVQDLKHKCKASGCPPARAIPSVPVYPQLVKTENEGEAAEDTVDFFSNVPQQPPLPPPLPQAVPANDLPAAASVSPTHVSTKQITSSPGGGPSSSPQKSNSDTRPPTSSPDPDPSGPRIYHTRSQVSALQAPLRELPGAGGDLVIVHAPWTPGDLRNLVKEFPNVREEPEKFREELRTVIQCYNPSWADVNQLLQVVMPAEVRQRLSRQADWPDADPGIERDLREARDRLLNSIVEVCPKKTDWTKINNCKQNKGEPPADYLDRLTKVFEQHSGIAQPAENAREAVGAAFVQGLLPKVQQQLRTICIGWQTKPLSELVTFANHCTACIEQKKESTETKLLALQLQTYQYRGRGVMSGGRGRGRGRGKGPSYPAPTGNTACHFCGPEGRWRNECPNRTSQNPSPPFPNPEAPAFPPPILIRTA
ncbi:unnamed protein product [Eretmochelys imbricata]